MKYVVNRAVLRFAKQRIIYAVFPITTTPEPHISDHTVVNRALVPVSTTWNSHAPSEGWFIHSSDAATNDIKPRLNINYTS
jgi:hypothetical protein